jgi:hypothetical protein
MSNLIVTIMAIGLASVVGLAGMFYGGESFMQSQRRNEANKIIEYLHGYENAIVLWSQRNGGVMPRPATAFPVGTAGYTIHNKTQIDSYLVPKYIRSNTVPPPLLSTTTSWSSMVLYRREVLSLVQNPFIVAFLGPTKSDLCYEIEKLRTGTKPGSLRVWAGSASAINAKVCGNFGCFEDSGAWGADVGYIVYHRLGGRRPNINYSDVNPITCS